MYAGKCAPILCHPDTPANCQSKNLVSYLYHAGGVIMPYPFPSHPHAPPWFVCVHLGGMP